MKNLSITTKFFVGGFIILTILGIMLAYFTNYFVNIILIERSKTFVAEFISLQTQNICWS